MYSDASIFTDCKKGKASSCCMICQHQLFMHAAQVSYAKSDMVLDTHKEDEVMG